MAVKYSRFTNLQVDNLLKVDGVDFETRIAAIEEDVTALEAFEAKGLKYLKVGTIAYTDTSGTAKSFATTIPAHAHIAQVICAVTTVFNSTVSDTIAVGITGTANKFLATTDITATTLGDYGKLAAYGTGASALTVQATWTSGGTAATTGSADVYVTYFEE